MSGNNDGKIPPPEPSPLGVLTGAALAGAAGGAVHCSDLGAEILIHELCDRLAGVEKKLAAVQAGAARLPQIEQLIVAHDQRLAQLVKHRHDEQGECVVRLG